MRIISINSNSIPFAWDGVTFKQFKQVLKAQLDKDQYAILGTFLRDADGKEIPVDVLKKSQVENFEVILARLRFLYEDPVWTEIPQTLKGITIPKDVTWESVEQFEMMRQLFSRELTPLETYEAYGKCAALYFQPKFDKADFDGTLAESDEIAAEIDQASCVEVVSVGRFFYAKHLSSSSGIPLSVLIQNTPRKKTKRASRYSTKLSAFTQRFKSLLATTSRSSPQSSK